MEEEDGGKGLTSPFSFIREKYNSYNEEINSIKGGKDMDFVGFVFFTFLGICTIVICARSGKLVLHLINGFFNALEERFM